MAGSEMALPFFWKVEISYFNLNFGGREPATVYGVRLSPKRAYPKLHHFCTHFKKKQQKIRDKAKQENT
jgi:hypothetical protein